MFGRGRGGGGGRQVCQFFMEGRCKFGDNCKNEHPAGQGSSQSQGGFGNRFSALNNQNGARGRPGGFGSGPSNQDNNPYNVSGETIKLDLTTERPIWPLSSYGPGRNAPLQLMEGDIEQSPEEMRVRHYLALSKGNPQESIQLEAQTAAKANEAIQRILGDINGAVKYIIDGKDQHPNRLDMESKGSTQQPAQQASAFGAPAAAPAASGFGQPSSMGSQGSTFGKPAFGQAAAPQSTFGQASAFGKPSQPGFGQASALGGGASAFGQPSNPGQSSAFGQPSSMGGGGSAFGQPSTVGQSSGFGQPSQMGQKPASGQSTFGQSSQPGFGQPSKPAFGQASAPGQRQGNPSPFGGAASQPSGFAQAAQQSSGGFGMAGASKPSPFAAAGSNQQSQSPFAAASTNNNNQQPQQQQNPFGGSSQSAFGQPSQPAAQQNPFGSAQPKPAFGQASQPTTSAFGQPSQPAANANPFGQPTQPQQQQATPSPFGAASTAPQPNGAAPTPNTTATTPSGGPDPSTYLTHTANQPTSFKNQPVTYLGEPKNFHVYPSNNRAERLWFPQGPPAPNPDVQLEPVFYEGALGAELQGIYEKVAQGGEFAGGVMPEVPPRREWIRFDI